MRPRSTPASAAYVSELTSSDPSYYLGHLGHTGGSAAAKERGAADRPADKPTVAPHAKFSPQLVSLVARRIAQANVLTGTEQEQERNELRDKLLAMVKPPTQAWGDGSETPSRPSRFQRLEF